MSPHPIDAQHFAALYEKAFLERAATYGEKDARTLEAARNLGLFLIKERKREAAETWLRRALGIAQSLHKQYSPEIATIQEALAQAVTGDSERQELHRQAARCTDPAIAASNLAKLAALQGDDATLLQQALTKQEQATGPQSAPVAARLNDLGLALLNVKPAAAAALFRRAMAINERTLGPRHPETATTLNNLANSLGEPGPAEPLLRRALAIFTATLGPGHERTGIATSNLAEAVAALGRDAESKRLYAQAQGIFEKALGPHHPWTREAAQNAR